MSLSERVLERMKQLPTTGDAANPQRIQEESDDIRVAVDVQAVDRLGAMVGRVQIDRLSKPAGPIDAVLKRQADRAVDRLGYLDGELRVVEVDAVAQSVQIRTRKPVTEDGKPQYTEVQLQGGTHGSVERKRGPDTVPFHVTPSELGRIVDDLGRVME